MESTYIKLEIRISALEGRSLPPADDILHRLIETIYDASIADRAIIDRVHITEIDGQPTNENP
nr:hypothetical protein [Pedobacter panaciterrae]